LSAPCRLTSSSTSSITLQSYSDRSQAAQASDRESGAAVHTRNTANADTENLPVLVVKRGSDIVFTKRCSAPISGRPVAQPEPIPLRHCLLPGRPTARNETLASRFQFSSRQTTGLGGTFYLRYRLHARPVQVHKAYPAAEEFAAAKHRHDPKLLSGSCSARFPLRGAAGQLRPL
jgi:hypothetical protein